MRNQRGKAASLEDMSRWHFGSGPFLKRGIITDHYNNDIVYSTEIKWDGDRLQWIRIIITCQDSILDSGLKECKYYPPSLFK